MSESKTSEKRLSAVERQRKALELRKQGYGFEQIARELGYGGPSGAFKAVHQALKKTLQEPADELRKLEGERLDVILSALWPDVLAGDPVAADKALKTMERRAKLLGLDAPTKIAPTDPSGEQEYGALSVEQRAERVAAILERARALRDRQAPGDAPAE